MTKITIYGQYLQDVAACKDPVMERGRRYSEHVWQDRVCDKVLSERSIKGERTQIAGEGMEISKSWQAMKKGPWIVLEGHDFNKNERKDYSTQGEKHKWRCEWRQTRLILEIVTIPFVLSTIA